MNITVLSMFSSSQSYLDTYFSQIESLLQKINVYRDNLSLILLEGDSKDNTYKILENHLFNLDIRSLLIKHDHGGKVYGSIEDPQRFAQLSKLWNLMLDSLWDDTDVVVVMESDLKWLSKQIHDLTHISYKYNLIIAPMVMDGPDSFYDVWAFRSQGERFTKEEPHYKPSNRTMYIERNKFVEIESAGSCLIMPGKIARIFRTTEEEELVGFCKQARRKEEKIWLCPYVRIYHPRKDTNTIENLRHPTEN